jgi:hypothetical protein
MPQLIKGGKYVFGWCYIHPDGRIMIPPEARNEYRFAPGEKLIVMSGSRTSKGFALTNHNLIQDTAPESLVDQIPEIKQFRELEDGFISFRNRIFTWTLLDHRGYIQILPEILARYSVRPGDKILAGRGSGLALAFIKEGQIIEEAINHPEIEVFD